MSLNIRTYHELTEADRSGLADQIGAQRRRVPVTSCTLHDGVIEPLVSAEGVRCFSMAFLLEDGRPLAFRGPETEGHVWREALEAATLREFLADVDWGALDELFVDLPPGVQRFQELTELLP